MQITQTMLDVCEEALCLLRQDVTLPTLANAPTDTGMEWVKCRKAFDYAAAEVLAAHDWEFVRCTDGAATSVDAWPLNVRKVLVYCLARDLSVQIAGRTEDLKNYHQLYSLILAEARVKDLAEDVSDDRFTREVMALVRPHYTIQSEDMPRSMVQFHERVAVARDLARTEVLTAHPWGFVTEEDRTGSGEAFDETDGEYRHIVPVPHDALTVLAVIGRQGEPCNWIRIADEIRATEPVAAIRYVRDEEDFGKWDPKVYRILVLKVASDVSKTVGGNAEEHSTLERMYRTALEEAKVRDTRQSNPGPAAVWGGNYYVDRMTGRRA